MFTNVKSFLKKVLRTEEENYSKELKNSEQSNNSQTEPKIKQLKRQLSYRKQASYR